MSAETDAALVNLLQIDPRMSFTKAGEILRISPTTAANRWHHLEEEGLAWVTCHPNPGHHVTAIVEVDCRTESLPVAIRQLCEHPMIASVDEATGRRDILLTVMAPDMNTLTELIIDWIGGLEGVYGTRSSLLTSMIVGTESWRINTLTHNQIRQATPTREAERPSVGLDEADLALADALARDPRTSIASLAAELDMPASTVHRRIRRMVANRHIVLRCDAAPELAGWRLECTWLTTIPLNYKTRVVKLLREQPSLRSCMWITGRNNLRVNFRVPHPTALGALESSIAASFPGLAPEETIIHLRSHKSMGWLLNAAGKRTGQLIPPVFQGCE